MIYKRHEQQGLQMIFPKISLSFVRIFFIGGLSSALPGVLTWQTFNLWLAHLGYTKSTIGLFFLTGAPYSLKIVFSWLVDRYKLPYLGMHLGHRREWAIFLAWSLGLLFILLGMTTGHISLWATAGICTLISICSAMNQITLIGHRVECTHNAYASEAVTSSIFGYRLGRFLGRAGVLFCLAYVSWSMIYCILGVVMLMTSLNYYYAPEPKRADISTKPSLHGQSTSFFYELFLEPLKLFQKRNQHWKGIVALFASLSLSDALLSGMLDLFYLDCGYTTFEIAYISKGFGLLCSLLGGVFALRAIERLGILLTLITSLVIHCLCCLLFISLSLNYLHASAGLLAGCVGLDYFSAALRASAIATWTTQLAAHEYLSGSSYAFFSSIKSLPFFLIATSAGLLADFLGWTHFFYLGILLCLPPILLIFNLYFQSNNFSSWQKKMLQSDYKTIK